MPWLERIAAILATGTGMRVVFQPIVDLRTMAVVGYEALSRFPSPRIERLTAEAREVLDSNGLGIGPALWFAEAAELGLLQPLEALAARVALARLPDVPDGRYLGVNMSPSTVLRPGVIDLLLAHDLRRVVLEITEQEPHPGDYAPLLAALAPLRTNGAGVGMRLAVDDVGAGASMAHALSLHADVVKIDVSVIRHIASDPGRRALARGFADYAHAIGASAVAEGIETDPELETIIELGVDLGQGYHPSLGKPHDLPVKEPA